MMDSLCSQCDRLMNKRKDGSTLVQLLSSEQKFTIKIVKPTNIPSPFKQIQFSDHSEGNNISTSLQLFNFHQIQPLSRYHDQQQAKCITLAGQINQKIGQLPNQLKRQSIQLNEQQLKDRLESISKRKLKQRNYAISKFFQGVLLINCLSVFIINITMFMQLFILHKAYSSIKQVNKFQINGVFYIYFISIFSPPIIKALNNYCCRSTSRPCKLLTLMIFEIFMLGPVLYSLQFFLKKKEILNALPNYRKKLQNLQLGKINLLINFAHSFKSVIYLSYYKSLEIFFIIREIYIPLASLTQIFSLLDIGLCFALYFVGQLTRKFIKSEITGQTEETRQINNDISLPQMQQGTVNQINI